MSIRIIVVDDEEDDLYWCVKALEGQEYKVFAPNDMSELLYMLDTINPHCVLCDHFLDEDTWGYSGAELAEELGGSIPWVLMTKRPLDVSNIAKVWQPGKGRSSKIQHFYNKVDNIEVLIEIMQEVVTTYIPLNFALDISPRDTARIINVVAPDLVGTADNGAIDRLRENVNDLLRMLFRTYRGVYIKREIYKGEALCLLHVGAEAEQHPGDNLLLLCGQKQQVCAVLKAYSTHGRTNGTLVRLDARERLDVAGAVFAFGGDLNQVWPLSDIWLNRPAAQTCELLDSLVTQHVDTWPIRSDDYRAGAEALATSSAQLGLGPGQLDPLVVEQRIPILCRAAARSLRITYATAERRFELAGRDGRLAAYPHPADALAQLERIGANWSARCGPSYGTAHANQILVDEQRGQLILWDYRPVAEGGPRLMYFALMEAHLRFEALHQGSPLDHYELERALLAAEEGRPGLALPPALQTVYETLLTFRSIVRRRAGLNDMRPYYALLLLCSISAMRPEQPGNRVSEGEIYAFLAALVLAERLLGATVAVRSQEGLFIDPRSEDVSVDGVKVEQERGRITPQDRRFLLYLYRRHDQLCSYKDILCDIYGSTTHDELQRMSAGEWDDLLKREQPRIHATLNRLRAIIEAEPGAPEEHMRRKMYKYLITKPRVGVTLRLRPTDERE